jgi:hypothetical protein
LAEPLKTRGRRRGKEPYDASTLALEARGRRRGGRPPPEEKIMLEIVALIIIGAVVGLTGLLLHCQFGKDPHR